MEGKRLGGRAWREMAALLAVCGAVLLVTWCKWVFSCSLSGWVTEHERTFLLGCHTCFWVPAWGQTESCTPTSVCRAQGALYFLLPLPTGPHWSNSTRERREQKISRVHPQPQTPGVGLNTQWALREGSSPTGLAPDYIPVLAALSCL